MADFLFQHAFMLWQDTSPHPAASFLTMLRS